jgi:hypothetical protein
MTAQRRLSAIQTGRRLTGLGQEETFKTVGVADTIGVEFAYAASAFSYINIETGKG